MFASRFRGWLWTIARNKIRDHYRQRDRRALGRGGDAAARELAELPEVWTDEASQATRSEVQALFRRAMNLIQGDFEPTTWRAFWLSAVEELPTAEIAQQLGVSLHSVRQAKSRVLRRLRAELGDARPPDH